MNRILQRLTTGRTVCPGFSDRSGNPKPYGVSEDLFLCPAVVRRFSIRVAPRQACGIKA